MKDENKVELTGKVIDWEEKYTPKGILTIKLNVSVHEEWDTGSKDVTIPCDLYGKSADYLKKKLDEKQVWAGTVVRCSGSLGSYTIKEKYLNLTFKCRKTEVVSNSGIAASEDDPPF